MINEYLTQLAIGVNGAVHSTTLSEEQAAALAQANQERAMWIVALLAILAGVLYFAFAHSKVKEKIKKSKNKRAEKKEIEKRTQEMERLHRNKNKNKRK